MSVIFNNKRYWVKTQENNNSLLNLSKKNIVDIQDIEGLDQLVYLSSLILEGNFIREIKGLSKLKNLKKLSLKNNKIKEIKGLDDLIQLEDLDLEQNNITEIKGLENLKELKYLNLWKNNINELKGLHKQIKLKSLGLYGNPVDLWIKAKLGPQENFPQAAVAYCRKLVGDVSYDINELNSFLEENWDKAIVTIHEQDYFGFFRILKDVYNNVNVIDNKIYYNFFGTILVEYPLMFDKKFSEYYNLYITKFLPNFSCLEMERFIIRNYCFYENEYLIASFFGRLLFKNEVIVGRIHVTNLRIIVFGSFQRKEDSDEIVYYGIGGVLLFEIFDSISLKFKRRTIDSFSVGKTVPRFGYDIPLFNPINVHQTQNYISFDLKVPTKYRKKRLSIMIEPKEIVKGLNQKEYNDNYELLKDLYNFIYKVNQKI